MTIQFDLVNKPSNSKGWARFSATADGRPVIMSRTGNQYVSASHAGEAEPGARIALTIQTMLRHGKGRTAREEIDTDKLALIAEPGATSEYRDQYVHIAITGARKEA